MDLESGSVRIEGTWDERSRTVGPPKSEGGYRRVPIAEEVVGALRSQRASLGALPHPRQFVFVNETIGQPFHPTTMRAHFKRVLREAGLPEETRVHDLRHGVCSVLANSEVPLTVARDQMGHSSVRMTERYVHPDQAAQRRAANTLATALGKRGGS